MRVLIADDHDLVREMMATYLEKEGGIKVTQTSNYEEAISEMRRNGPFELVLLDYKMPGMRGLGGLREALASSGGNPVALVSGDADRSIAEEALDSGAAGFLPKTMTAKSVVNAVKFMALGETFAPIDFMTAGGDANPALREFTTREQQVLKGLTAGKSNKEIGRDCGIQEVTVKLHVKSLCRKLGAKNRTQAAMAARDRHLA